VSEDWLSVKSPAEEAAERIRKEKEREFSELYVAAFVRNVAGAELLSQWTKGLGNKRTPVNAPHTEYAANEAVRAFIDSIHEQIRLAQ
jgi:hypothetical protein